MNSNTDSNKTEWENSTLWHYLQLSGYKGYVDPAYIESINPFWLKFPPPSTATHYAFGILYLLMTIIGCAGNAFVIYMFIRCKTIRTPANILVINLVISDFIMLSMGIMFAYNSFQFGPASGNLGCRVYGFLGGITGTASIVTLTAISVDRYHVIVYPLDPLKSTTTRKSIVTIVLVWIYSFSFAIIPAIDTGITTFVPEGYLTACSFDYLTQDKNTRIFIFLYFIAAWFAPVTIISYCYFYILRVVVTSNSIQSSKNVKKIELKLAAVVIAIIGLWFIAWTPYAVVALLGISGYEHLITPTGSMVPAIFCKIAACVDPYVYAVTHPRFRSEFRRVFLGEIPLNKRTSTLKSSVSSTRSRAGETIAIESVANNPRGIEKSASCASSTETSFSAIECPTPSAAELSEKY